MPLSATQQQILDAATRHPTGLLVWFPDKVNGGARDCVLASLLQRGLIEPHVGGYRASLSAYAALDRAYPAAVAQGATQLEAGPTPRNPRANSKQALLISMLQRPEGATIEQLCTATQWQAHTVRGALAGVVRKKLGLNLSSEKMSGQQRTYRIT
ncbi:DUF3489 domain-containing protein [Chitinilyticum aquatile]|uniref:DUF3489 domain-containing protein n=1 Tax=Chitinilyticum aquatile TaxID=362520 RepID=UPI0003FAF4F0|nr:DUF3489 domain-containing protein [Chitinilyticum aquatile]